MSKLKRAGTKNLNPASYFLKIGGMRVLDENNKLEQLAKGMLLLLFPLLLYLFSTSFSALTLTLVIFLFGVCLFSPLNTLSLSFL